MRSVPALPRSRRVRAGLYGSVLALLVMGLVAPRVNHAQTRLLTAIAVTPAGPTLGIGQVEPFQAQGTFNDTSSETLSAGGGTWADAASLTTPRFYHSATRLQDGTVLVVGGYNGANVFASAERYYPASNTWVSAGTMTTPRFSHTATLLPNGKVLVAGGRYTDGNGTLTNTTEIYDPFSNSWSPGASLSLGARASHTAVLLGTGKVLVAAGLVGYPDCTYRADAELYDPGANTWTATGSLSLRRSSATIALLADGKVLLAAGPSNGCPSPNNGLNEAEVYNPALGTWAVTGTLSAPRYNNTITVLPNGKVLLAGGYSVGGVTATADLYNPAAVGTFSPAGSLLTARVATGGTGDNGATPLLQNGQVLVAGGTDISGTIIGSAELYEHPASSTWTTTGSLTTPREYNTATLLDDGRVLVAGGLGAGNVKLSSAEIYLPKVAWTSSNPSVATIDQLTGVATAVATGTTTITATSGNGSGSTTLTVAVDTEAPTTNANAPAPNGHGWNNVNVDVNLDAFDTGGAVAASGVQSITYTLTGAQTGGGTVNTSHTSFTIFTEGTTTVTYYATDNRGNVETAHTLTINLDKTQPTLAPLPNITVNGTSTTGAPATFSPVAFDAVSGVDTVLATQGLPSGSTFPYGTTTEQVTVTDNAGNNTFRTFSVTVNNTLVSIAVTPLTATLGQGSTPFTATGTYSDGSTPALGASGGTWTASASLATPRLYHSATRLQDGSVLVAGGYNGTTTFASAERYYPATNTWVPAGSMASERISHSATLLPNGKVLVVGGRRPNDLMYDTTELYDPASNSWAPGPSLHLGVRSSHSAVLLGNGKVLVAAGLQSYPDCTYRTDAELYDSTTNTWTTTGSLALARGSATATLLANGKVLLAAGPANNCPTPNYGMSEAEVYDPAGGTWAVTGNLSAPRYGNGITVLPNGKVLLAGGYSAGTLASADVYDPAAGTFSLTGPLGAARMTSSGSGDNGALPLLQNGLVLFAGGSNDSGILASAELYNPATGAWTPTGSLATGRTFNTATLLQDGRVLVVGGLDGGSVTLGSGELYTPPSLVWGTSNSNVATIDEHGVATAVSSGSVTIAAKSGNIVGHATLTVDLTAPTTTATPSPAANGGWNNSNVTVNLNATDNPGGGVQSIVYSFNGPQNGGPFTVNGNFASLQIGAEGTTTVHYHAVDTLGNVESDHTLTVKLDKTAPFISFPFQVQTQATSSAGAVVTFSVSASDSFSGLVGTVSVSPIVSGFTFPPGTTHETATATDAAGNTATAHFDVVVNPSRPAVNVVGGTFIADGNPHPAVGAAKDFATNTPVSGTFNFQYTPPAPGGPVAAGRYSAAGNFTSADPAYASVNAWSTMAVDVARQGATAGVLNGQLYVVGGHPYGDPTAAIPVLSRNAAYDPFSNTWTAKANPLTLRNLAGAGVINNKLYVVGGCIDSDCGAKTTSTLEAFDAAANNWAPLASMPTPRNSMAVGAINGLLYVAGGGIPFGPTSVLEVYDPATNSWDTSRAPMQVGVTGAAAAAFNGKLYVFGGTDAVGPTGRVQIYDPATNTWAGNGATLPTNTTGATAVTANGLIYLFGGSNGSGILAQAWSYDPNANAWTGELPMPTPRFALVAAFMNGSIYLVGGSNAPSGVTGVNEQLFLPLTTHITINQPLAPPAFGASPITAVKGTGSSFTFSGTGAPGANVSIVEGPNQVQGGILVDGSGNWSRSVTVDSFLVGPHTLTATQSSNGQTSGASTPVIVHVRPPVPSFNSQNSVSSATSPANVPLSGSGFYGGGQTPPTGSTVTIFEGATVLGFTDVQQNGQWAATVQLPYGPHTLTATQTLAGETSDAATFTVSVNPPLAPPTLTILPVTVVSGAAVTFSGTGVSGASVTLFDGASNIGGGISVTGGQWSTTRTGGFLVGGHAMTATQSSGNQTSGASPSVTLHVRPSTPSINSPSSVSSAVTPASVTLNGNGFYGSGQTPPTGSAITIFENGAQIGTATVQPGGQWSATIPLAYGAHALNVSQTLAGETSDLSNAFTVTVTQPLTLLSISVSPSSALTGVGQTPQFQAFGSFSDGVTRPLSTGGSGGSGGGTTTLTWNLHFASQLNVGACASGTTFSSQAVSPNSSGVVSNTWGTPAVVQVGGTLAAPTAPAPQVNLTLACIPGNGSSGSVVATWTGTRYEGTATLSGSSVPVSITGWSTKASLPTPRSGISAATVNGIVYVMGGGNPSLAQTVDTYDPGTNTWSTVAQMQTPREGAGIAALNNKIYVAGGHIVGGAASGVFEVFDPATSLWDVLPSMTTPRAHLALVAAGGKLYAIGGDTGANNSNTTAVVEIYDPVQNQWFARMPMSAPRNSFAAGALNSDATIVVAGGAGSGPSTELYNVATDTWTTGSPMPGQGISSATVANNALWVFGGNNGVNTVQMFRLAIGQLPSGWATLGGMPTGRGQSAAASVGDVAYVIGGQANGVTLAVVEAFSTPPPADLAVNTGSGGGGGGSSLPTVQWQSADTSVATVNQSGSATAVGAGQTTITASACPTTSSCTSAARISGSASLTVQPPARTILTLAPGSVVFPSVSVTATDLVTGEADGTFIVPIGVPQTIEPGSYHLVFTPPNGYTVSPAQIDITMVASNDITIPLLFAEIDTTPPTISAPADVVAGTGPGSTQVGALVTDAVLGSAVASDNSGSVTVTRTGVPAGNFFALGTTTVTYTATDASGNSASAVQHVTVNDTTPPAIDPHGTVTASALDAFGALVSYVSPVTHDNVDMAGVASCSPASGAQFALGTTTVTCNATDAAGNPATPTTFNVVVSDTTPPTIDPHANLTATATNGIGRVVTYLAPATHDNVDLAGVAACSPLSGTQFPIGTTHVLCDATDAAGNHAAQTTFDVIVSGKLAQTVTFTGAPATAVFGATFTVSASTNASTAPVITATGACIMTTDVTVTMTSGSGTCRVTAKWPADADYIVATATQTTIATKADPGLAWATPSAIAFGSPLSPTELDATASVPGVFTYHPALGTVPAGGTDTLSVTFKPTDGADYATATTSVTILVTQVTPTITWPQPAAIVYGAKLGAAELNAQASASGQSVAGAFTYTPAKGTVLTAGIQTLSVTFTPTNAAGYTTATASVTLEVDQAPPVVKWNTPAAIVYGTALGAAQLKATSVTPGTFDYTPAEGVVPGAGAQTLSVVFTPADGTNYATVTQTVTLQVNQAAPVITWTKPAAIVYGTPLSTTELSATANVDGAFTYTPALGEVLGVGVQTLSVTFTPADATDYKPAAKTVTLNVTRATPLVDWPAPAPIVHGTALSGIQQNATASVAGTFAYSPGAGTVLGVGLRTLTVTFTPDDTTDYKNVVQKVTIVVTP